MDTARFRRPPFMRVLALLCLWFSVNAGAAAREAPARPSEDDEARAYGRRGLDLMMDGDLNAAIEIFHDIQKKDPQSPLGYLLEADAVWWRIYYATANLVDPDVFAATDLPTTPHDCHFGDLLTITIEKSGARIHSGEDVARNYLYQGMAYALRARLEGLRDRDLPTARAGKKMRTSLLKALELDSNLTDAYLGVGIYNYFVDTLSAIVKILRFFIGLPGGSRIEGLKQMQLAAEKGDLTRAEAKFYLAKDFSRPSERQFDRSLQLFHELAREYPHNPLWPMLISSLQCRMGHDQECDSGYRVVYLKTAGKKTEVEQALRRAARQALQRRHPQEQFAE
jgi:tetratricopeptide (TPR) repeat protein